MSKKSEIERTAEAMIRAGEKLLDDARSIHAPCKNAYKDSRDGFTYCTCWRCRPQDPGR